MTQLRPLLRSLLRAAGRDHRAIARTVDISEGMSRQHAFEARRVLQQELGADFLKDYFGE